MPFSGGSGVCPGRNIALLLTSGMLAAVIGDRRIRMQDPHRLPPDKLLGTLDHFTLRFELGRAGPSRAPSADVRLAEQTSASAT